MLKVLFSYDDLHCQMTDREVMTRAIVVALYFAGNFEPARELLVKLRSMPQMLVKCRFHRRLHWIGRLFLTAAEDIFRSIPGEPRKKLELSLSVEDV